MADAINTPRPTTTAADFAAWEAKADRMSNDSLAWAVRDCHEAADCADAMGKGLESGRYLDEAATYMRELNRRAPRRNDGLVEVWGNWPA